MNGLEAIELMKKGKMTFYKISTTGEVVLNKIEGNDVYWCQDYELNIGVWRIEDAFDFSRTYEEYIEPESLTGWERVKEGSIYRVSHADGIELKAERGVFSECDYKNANYFSTKEKAEEISFKQTLLRKLQRFSDETGGTEIDWNDEYQNKFIIKYSHFSSKLIIDRYHSIQYFGQVYFVSKDVARKAIELFHDDLIKYFTM